MKDKISIIIPVYNLEKYIKRAVESVLKQTYSNIEVIIVDDGSSDKSWTIIQEIADGDNRVVPIHQENGGVTSARLNGVRHSMGEWIGFVDGDDEVEPDMYEILLNNAKKYNADISHCGYQMIFDDGRVNYFHNTGCFVEQDRTKALKDLLDGSLVEPGLWNKLFHKNLFHSLLHSTVMDENIKINEDLLMNYILFLNAKISIFEDRCLYHYIVRSTSASRVKLNEHRIFDPIRVKKIILTLAKEDMLLSAQKAYVRTCINVYNSIVLEKKNKYKSERDEIRKLICEEKGCFYLLSRKQQILGYLIYKVPRVYPFLYKIYSKFLLKDKYR